MELSNPLNHIPGLIFFLDHNLNIVEVNHNAMNAFKRAHGDIVGSHFSEIFDSFGFINLLGEFTKSNETVTIINQNLIIDKQNYFYKFTVKKVSNNPPLIMIFGEDHTKFFLKQKELENYKLKTLQITKLATLGEITTGINQELKNPLMMIINILNQVRREVTSSEINNSEIDKKILRINKNAKRIIKIVKNMDLFTKDNTNEPLESVLVIDLIGNGLELCRDKLKGSNISLIIDDIDPNLKVDCKVSQISQIILNLIGNSKDAISNQDKKWIKISAYDAGESVQFKITDSGLGIPKEIREKLNGEFFTTKNDQAGSGAGLTNSKKIIEAHLGKFYIEAENPNTCFVFDIPKGLNGMI